MSDGNSADGAWGCKATSASCAPWAARGAWRSGTEADGLAHGGGLGGLQQARTPVGAPRGKPKRQRAYLMHHLKYRAALPADAARPDQ